MLLVPCSHDSVDTRALSFLRQIFDPKIAAFQSEEET